MKLRKLTALGLAVIMTLAVAACGKTETKTSEKESTPAKESAAASESKTSESTPAASESKVEEKKDWSDTTLRVAWWGGDARNTYTTQVLDNFVAELYPGLKLEVEYAGFGDYFTKLTTQASANTLPDVFMMDMGKIDMFAAGGSMADLGPYVESGAIDTTNIDDGALASGVVNGTLHCISTGSNAYGLFFDPAIVKEAGVTLEIQPKWSDFLEACDTIYEKTGKKALIAFYDASNKLFDVYLRSQGKSMYTEDKKAFGFTAEEFTEWCEFQYDTEQKESIQNGVMWEGGEHFSELQEANPLWAIFGAETSNNLNSYEAGSGKELDVISYPVADNATTTGTFLKATMLWTMSANSENKDIAAAFLNYYANTKEVYDLAGLDRGVPINSEVCDYLAENAEPVNARGINFINTLASEGMAGPGIVTPGGSAEAQQKLAAVCEAISYGQLAKEDIAAAVETAYKEASDILAANN